MSLKMILPEKLSKFLRAKSIFRNDIDDSKLSQLRLWNIALIFSIIGTIIFAIIFVLIAKIDEVVVGRGKIQAIGAERPIKTKINGIIDKVMIKEGDKVKKEQILISLNTDSLKERFSTLLKEKHNLEKSLEIQKEIIDRVRRVYNEGAITLLEVLRSEKILLEINSDLEKKESEIRLTSIALKNSVITSPIDGNVFDLIPKNSGYYTNAGETLLKIVPDGEIEAKIFINNNDIGFIKEGMRAEIRIDAYPFSRFGSISGRVLNIGDEALPADNFNPKSRFPVYLNLENRYISKNKNKFLIKPGQSVSVNLIVKERPVINLFTDIYSNAVDSLKSIKSNK